MSTSEGRPGSWRNDPGDEGSGARSSELTSVEARRESTSSPARTSSSPERSDAASSTGPIPRGAPVRRRPGLRRVKRILRHVDPISVLKLALFYSLIFLAMWMVLVAILYWLVEGRGFFDGIEDLSEGLALGWDLNITLFWVEKWAFLIGLTVAILGSLMSAVFVVVYNVAADLFGGVEMTHVERDL